MIRQNSGAHEQLSCIKRVQLLVSVTVSNYVVRTAITCIQNIEENSRNMI